MVFILLREKLCEVTMPNLNLNFLKDLFKVGMTKEQFIGAYSEMFNETGMTDEQLEGMSIFDADKKEAVAGDLFDMLNINKATDGKEDVLDADEIKKFANLDNSDGEDTLTLSDLNVLMKDYQKNLLSETKLDTPEKMYEAAMAKPSVTGNPVDAYLQALDYQISAMEDMVQRRQSGSAQVLLGYQNEINTLVQNDTNISNDLKAKYSKENSNLNSLVAKQAQLNAQINNKQSELDSAKADYQNIQANIEYDENGQAIYGSELSDAEKTVSKLGDDLASLDTNYSKIGAQISKSRQSLQSMQSEMKSQSRDLRAKMDIVNKKIETEQAACIKDVENYNSHIKSLKEAQTYAIQRVQTEAAAASSSSESVGNGDDTYVYDESNYDEAAVAALEQRWASKAQKYGLDHKFFAKVTAISKDLKCDPNALLAVMNSECGLNAAARNPNGGATGLIQFMPSTAKALGTSTAALAKMSAYDQLDYVAKFFKMNMKTFKMGNGPMSAADLYSLIFLPARANRDVLTSQGENFYSANAGLDMDGDGKITKADLNRRINKCML